MPEARTSSMVSEPTSELRSPAIFPPMEILSKKNLNLTPANQWQPRQDPFYESSFLWQFLQSRGRSTKTAIYDDLSGYHQRFGLNPDLWISWQDLVKIRKDLDPSYRNDDGIMKTPAERKFEKLIADLESKDALQYTIFSTRLIPNFRTRRSPGSNACSGVISRQQVENHSVKVAGREQYAKNSTRACKSDDRVLADDRFQRYDLHRAGDYQVFDEMSYREQLSWKQNATAMGSEFGDVEFKARVGMPQDSSKSRIAYQGVTMAAYNPPSLETMSDAKYPVKDWMHSAKDRHQHKVQKGNQVDCSIGDQSYRHVKMAREVISFGPQVQADEWSIKSKTWKHEDNFKSGKGRIGLDLTARSYKTSPAQISDIYAKTALGKFKDKSVYNGGIAMGYPRGDPMFSQSDETESDSLENLEEDGEMNQYLNKGYPIAATEGRQSGGIKTMYDSKMSSKITKEDKKVHSRIYFPEMEPYFSKRNHTSKTVDPSYMEIIVLGKKTQASHPSGKLQQSWHKSYNADKQRKGAVDLDHFLEPNYMHVYGNGILDENASYLDGRSQYIDGQMQNNISAKKRKGNVEVMNQYVTVETVYSQFNPMQQIDEANFIKKGKRKTDVVNTLAPSVVTPEKMMPEKATSDVEAESKPQKKPFTLLTPSKHTGFSFSNIHLLACVMMQDASVCSQVLAAETNKQLFKFLGPGNEASIRAEAAGALKFFPAQCKEFRHEIANFSGIPALINTMIASSKEFMQGEYGQALQENAMCALANISGSLSNFISSLGESLESCSSPACIADTIGALASTLMIYDECTIEALATLYGNALLLKFLITADVKRVFVDLITMITDEVHELKVDKVVVRLIPDPHQVANAIKEKERIDGVVEYFPGVTGFQSRSLILGGQKYRPVFYRKEDLEDLLLKAFRRHNQLNPAFSKGNIQVSVLEEIINGRKEMMLWNWKRKRWKFYHGAKVEFEEGSSVALQPNYSISAPKFIFSCGFSFLSAHLLEHLICWRYHMNKF